MSKVLHHVSTSQSVHIAGAQRMVVLIKVIIRVVNSIISSSITALIRTLSLLGSFPTLKHWTWTLHVIHFNSMQR